MILLFADQPSAALHLCDCSKLTSVSDPLCCAGVAQDVKHFKWISLRILKLWHGGFVQCTAIAFKRVLTHGLWLRKLHVIHVFCNIFVCPLSYPIYIANFLQCFLCMSLLERGVLCCVTMSWMRNINRFTPLLNNILAQKLHENFKHNDLHPCLWRCVVLCKFVPEFLQNGRNSFNSESCIYLYLSIYLSYNSVYLCLRK